ncbi:MAG: carbon monoxide dehydrogenase subunit G [Acidobacteria bacterium]|nr:carbon monoxide dehydrogenase subunit G [Acidobacteriota bacterium]
MAIKLQGEFEVRKKQQDVYNFLTDPNRFAPLLPDFQELEVQDNKHFTVKVKLGVSYIRGTATVKMELSEAQPPSRAAYRGTGSVVGGSVDMNAGFDLTESPQGTVVKWNGEAQISGRLASVAGGLLEPLAKKNMQNLIDSLKSALEKQA